MASGRGDSTSHRMLSLGFEIATHQPKVNWDSKGEFMQELGSPGDGEVLNHQGPCKSRSRPSIPGLREEEARQVGTRARGLRGQCWNPDEMEMLLDMLPEGGMNTGFSFSPEFPSPPAPSHRAEHS